MAYTNIWSLSTPTGAEAANSIDDIFRSVKQDLQERLADIFGISDFTVDPLRPANLKFTDSADSVINLGDNGGPSRVLSVKNKANSQTYFTISSVASSFTVPVSITTGLVVTAQLAALTANSSVIDQVTGIARFYAIGADAATKGQIQFNVATTSGTTILAASINSAGLFTLNAGFTVATGTSTLQGLTATNAVFSGIVTASNTNLNLETAADTSNVRIQTYNAKTLFINELGNAVTFGAVGTPITVNIHNTLHAFGAITGDSGLTITAGTSALQAITATTLTTTSSILQANNQYLLGTTSGAVAHRLIGLDNTNIIQIAADTDKVQIINSILQLGSDPTAVFGDRIRSRIDTSAAGTVENTHIETHISASCIGTKYAVDAGVYTDHPTGAVQAITCIGTGLIQTGAGTTSSVSMFVANLVVQAGVVTSASMLRILAPSLSGGGTVGTLIGVDIGNMVAAGVSSVWAIRTGTGLVQFGDLLVTAASTTASSGFRLPAGTAPTSPADGDMWYDGSVFKVRQAGTTKTISVF